MALYSEFQYGDGVLYGSNSPTLKFSAVVGTSYGGSRSGQVSLSWDIAGMVDRAGSTAFMIVARPLSPATTPEEGEVVLLDWRAEANMVGSQEYYVSQAGQWTYFSLFLMGPDRHWEWASFRLALPVSDWDYTGILSRLLPGAMTSDEQNVGSGPSDGNLLVELLSEFGFVLDEIKTSAEALVPFWSSENIVPQAIPAVARMLDLPYIAALGPEVYRKLLSIKSDDSNIDIIGMKTSAVTRWHTRVRPSTNNLISLNDSSGETAIGSWRPPNDSTSSVPVFEAVLSSGTAYLHSKINATGISVGNSIRVSGMGAPFDGTFTVTAKSTQSLPGGTIYKIHYALAGFTDITKKATGGAVSKVSATPTRVLHGTYPAKLDTNDLQHEAFHRFTGGTGTWVCGEFLNGQPNRMLSVRQWPTVFGGFFLKINSGSAVSVSLSLDTYLSPTDPTSTNVPLVTLTGLSAASNGSWQWYSSGVVALNTDALARPKIVISPTSAEVDIDLVTVGPAPLAYRAVPQVQAAVVRNREYDQSTLTYNNAGVPYDQLEVSLSTLEAPSHSSAMIDWGDDTATQTVAWSTMATTPQIHDYTTRVVQDEFIRFFITVRDANDPLIAASTSLLIGEEPN